MLLKRYSVASSALDIVKFLDFLCGNKTLLEKRSLLQKTPFEKCFVVLHIVFCLKVIFDSGAIAQCEQAFRRKVKYLAERQALEPVLSQNITQSQMPINNQLITIIIKSKYY